MILMRVTTVASVTGARTKFQNLSTKAATTNFVRSLQSHSPHHTPSRPLCYPQYKQQATKRSIRRVRSTSLKREPPRHKQLLRTALVCNVRIHPTIRSLDPISTLHTNDKQQHAAPDAYGTHFSSSEGGSRPPGGYRASAGRRPRHVRGP